MHLIRAILLPAIVIMTGCEASSKCERRTDAPSAIEEYTIMQKTAHRRLAELIDSCWDFRDPKASEHRFREAALQEDDERSRLVLLTQVARAQGLQRRFDAAHATLDEVHHLMPQSPNEKQSNTVQPWYAIERGRVFNSSGQLDQALPLFQEALEAAKRLKQDAIAVDAAHMLAIVTSGEESVQWNHRSLELAESSADQRAQRWQASLHNNLGWSYHDQGEYKLALEHFQQALTAREARGQAREKLIARWAVGRCLRSMGSVEEALAHQMKLKNAWEQLGEPDGYVFEEIGECLFLLSRTEEARPYFADAYELLRLDSWLSATEPNRLKRLAQLGGLEVSPEQEHAPDQ